MSHEWDSLLLNVRLATMQGEGLGLLDNAAIATQGGAIAWVGAMATLPPGATAGTKHVRRCSGELVTPGLIDCHTHLVFGGNRAREFDLRAAGATYEEIARAGGGIRSTVAATRRAARLPGALALEAGGRLAALMHEGVTTIEIKSGYGLDTQTELQILREVRSLHDPSRINIVATFLGAHAVPAEYEGRADDYLSYVCDDMLPEVKRQALADAVDIFCENVGFDLAQTQRVFEAARALGMPLKIHAEQLSNMGGAKLAAGFGALSADHLEYLDEAGVAAMAHAGMVAVLLPGAFYCLREKQLPPVALLRRHGVPLAVASDLNPGTSPIVSLQASMNMACTLFRLTPAEVLRGVTVNAARALGLSDRGVLAAGKRADFCMWNVGEPAEVCYWMGGIRPLSITVGGVARDNTAGGWAGLSS